MYSFLLISNKSFLIKVYCPGNRGCGGSVVRKLYNTGGVGGGGGG
jgi:hypothetical protein